MNRLWLLFSPECSTPFISNRICIQTKVTCEQMNLSQFNMLRLLVCCLYVHSFLLKGLWNKSNIQHEDDEYRSSHDVRGEVNLTLNSSFWALLCPNLSKPKFPLSEIQTLRFISQFYYYGEQQARKKTRMYVKFLGHSNSLVTESCYSAALK